MMFWGNHQILWLAVVAVSLMATLIVRLGVAHFQREALLGREIDMLNLRWMGRTFWKAFRGNATSLWNWYRVEVWGALRRIKVSVMVLLVLGILGIAVSYIYTSTQLPGLLTDVSQQDVRGLVQDALGTPTGSDITFQFIWGHNLQAVALISLLGLFSFGVLGALSYIVNMGVIGAVLGAFQVFGYSPFLLALTGILPHGIFELTALTLTGATVLYIGALLVTPDSSRTLGEVLLGALADMFKILLAVVVPLLTIAAVIETYLTPALLALVMK
jgi:stage II sporulation protein M